MAAPVWRSSHRSYVRTSPGAQHVLHLPANQVSGSLTDTTRTFSSGVGLRPEPPAAHALLFVPSEAGGHVLGSQSDPRGGIPFVTRFNLRPLHRAGLGLVSVARPSFCRRTARSMNGP